MHLFLIVFSAVFLAIFLAHRLRDVPLNEIFTAALFLILWGGGIALIWWFSWHWVYSFSEGDVGAAWLYSTAAAIMGPALLNSLWKELRHGRANREREREWNKNWQEMLEEYRRTNPEWRAELINSRKLALNEPPPPGFWARLNHYSAQQELRSIWNDEIGYGEVNPAHQRFMDRRKLKLEADSRRIMARWRKRAVLPRARE